MVWWRVPGRSARLSLCVRTRSAFRRRRAKRRLHHFSDRTAEAVHGGGVPFGASLREVVFRRSLPGGLRLFFLRAGEFLVAVGRGFGQARVGYGVCFGLPAAGKCNCAGRAIATFSAIQLPEQLSNPHGRPEFDLRGPHFQVPVVALAGIGLRPMLAVSCW